MGFDLLGYVSYGTGRYGHCITFCRLSGWVRLYIVNVAMSNKYGIDGLGLLPRNLQPHVLGNTKYLYCIPQRKEIVFLPRFPTPGD
jgi:hypothetical protein